MTDYLFIHLILIGCLPHYQDLVEGTPWEEGQTTLVGLEPGLRVGVISWTQESNGRSSTWQYFPAFGNRLIVSDPAGTRSVNYTKFMGNENEFHSLPSRFSPNIMMAVSLFYIWGGQR